MDSKPAVERAELLIIGAGIAGIAMGAQLRRRGHRDFIMIERSDEVGGTWRDNTYPGAACDVPSHLYSFSWAMNPHWSDLYASGPEIQEYLVRVARDEGLYPHIRFGADVDEARWDPEANLWTVRTTGGTYTGRYLITGTGHLADPRMPEIPGIDGFTGEVFHSARWNHDVDLTGKRVAVVGTGASAVQIIPEVAKIADELIVFQRTPAWVIPRMIRPYPPATRRMFERAPESMRREREDIFWLAESYYPARRAVPTALETLRRQSLGHLAAAIDDPALQERLTPDYLPGCKRVLFSNTYYPTFARSNVTLEPNALTQLAGSTAISADGTGYDVDAIVLCTGFEAARPPIADRIRTGDGSTLAEHWSTGMAAIDSTAVAGFPNLFTINGPNTSLGHNSIVYIIESQVHYVLDALDRADRDGLRTLVPTVAAQDDYADDLQRRAATTVWLRDGGCGSWYVDPRSGKLTLIWPDFAYDFRARNGRFTGRGFLARRDSEQESPMAIEAAGPGYS